MSGLSDALGYDYLSLCDTASESDMTALLHHKPGTGRWISPSVGGPSTRDNTVDEPQRVGPPQKNRRRERTHFPVRSIAILEEAFSDNRYPDITRRERLAAQLTVEEARVHTWFQNKRARQKRSIKSQRAASPSPPRVARAPRKPVRPLPTSTSSPTSSTDSATEVWRTQPSTSFKRPWCGDKEETLFKRRHNDTKSAPRDVMVDANEPLDLTTRDKNHRESDVDNDITPPAQQPMSAVRSPPSPTTLPLYLAQYASHIFPTSPGLTPFACSPSAVGLTNTAFTFPPTQPFSFPPFTPSMTSRHRYRSWKLLNDTAGSSDSDSSGYISQISPERF